MQFTIQGHHSPSSIKSKGTDLLLIPRSPAVSQIAEFRPSNFEPAASVPFCPDIGNQINCPDCRISLTEGRVFAWRAAKTSRSDQVNSPADARNLQSRIDNLKHDRISETWTRMMRTNIGFNLEQSLMKIFLRADFPILKNWVRYYRYYHFKLPSVQVVVTTALITFSTPTIFKLTI
jgi:hypothetical protein